MLIGLLAKKGFGKDTAGDYIVRKFGFKKVALAQPLKDACKPLFGFDDEQLYGNLKEVVDPRWGVSPRRVMQYLGTEFFRSGINNVIPGIGEDFWLNIMKVNFDEDRKSDPNTKYVVSDVRFQNEVDGIHRMGGIVIKIDRPILADDQHASEKNIDLIENYDYLIQNNGTIDEFYNKIDLTVSKILKEMKIV